MHRLATSYLDETVCLKKTGLNRIFEILIKRSSRIRRIGQQVLMLSLFLSKPVCVNSSLI